MRNPFRTFALQLCAVMVLAFCAGAGATAKPASADYLVHLYEVQGSAVDGYVAVHVDSYGSDVQPTPQQIAETSSTTAPNAVIYVTVEVDANGNSINVVDSGQIPGTEMRKSPPVMPTAPVSVCEQQCVGASKPTIKLNLYLGSAEPAPYFQSGQPHGFMGELKLNVIGRDVSFWAEARDAFYDGGYLGKKSRLKLGIAVPLGHGSPVAFFAEHERAWRTGDEWGWAGLRFDLGRLFN